MDMINTNFNSMMGLLKEFSTEQKCIDYLTEQRWNGNVVSPFDPKSKVYVCKNNKYRCKNTGKYFNVRTGTMFDNTKLPLQKWFLAIYLITSHKKGISSLQLSRDIDITQKSAYFMLQRIRNCFGIDNNEQLNNEVEVDETYLGPEKGKMNTQRRKRIEHTQGMEHKKPILGILERGGKIKAMVLKKSNGATIKPILFDKINEAATVITDGFAGYKDINKVFRKHVIINHAAGIYAEGNYHTNSVEGFWSLLKRGVVGIYHYVSVKHLQKYVDEFTFRYNTRDYKEAERFNALLLNMGNRLTYKQLIK